MEKRHWSRWQRQNFSIIHAIDFLQWKEKRIKKNNNNTKASCNFWKNFTGRNKKNKKQIKESAEGRREWKTKGFFKCFPNFVWEDYVSNWKLVDRVKNVKSVQIFIHKNFLILSLVGSTRFFFLLIAINVH